MSSEECLFCDRDNQDAHKVIDENELAYARWDNFPATDGHTQVVPKRHVESFFDLNDDELSALYSLAKSVKQIIEDRYSPEAFNIGVNDGEAAGRTVHHLHIHLIPRYKGDVEKPRGGIRHIIPGKGNY